MPKTVTLRIDDDLYNNIKAHAESDNRSLSNFIETATIRYIEETDFVDDYEMEEILSNTDLIARYEHKIRLDFSNLRLYKQLKIPQS